MNTFTFAVGVIGNVISVLMFLSPLPTFWRIVKHRSTEEFESLPYICTLLNSALWVYYGVTRSESYLVATINGFGVVAETVFVALFLIFAPTKTRGKTMLLVGILDVGFFVAAVLVTQFLTEGDTRIDVIGLLCDALNIVMYVSPLAAMKTVVTTKSVEYMPFFLSFFLFLNGGIWTTYAVLAHDWFLFVPNGIGFLLGTAQLLLYAIYMNSKASKHAAAAADMEEARPTEPLLRSSSADPSIHDHITES